MIADLDGARAARRMRDRGGRDPGAHRPRPTRTSRPAAAAIVTSFSSRRPDCIRPPAQAGRRRTGRPDPLLDADEVRRLAVRRLRRHEHGGAARHGRGRAARAAAPELDAAAGQVGADVHRRPGLGQHGAHERGARSRSRAPVSINVARANDPQLFTDPVVALVRRPRRHGRRGHAQLDPARSPTPAAVPGTWPVELQPQSATGGRDDRVPPHRDDRAREARSTCRSTAHAAAGAATGDNYGLRRADEGRRDAPHPVLLRGHAAGARERPARPAEDAPDGRHRHGVRTRHAVPLPDVALRPAADLLRPPRSARRARRSSTRSDLDVPVVELRRRRSCSQSANSRDRSVGARLEGRERRAGLRAALRSTSTASCSTTARTSSAAGAAFPRTKRYYVSVDSGSDAFTGQSLPGQYVLKAGSTT